MSIEEKYKSAKGVAFIPDVLLGVESLLLGASAAADTAGAGTGAGNSTDANNAEQDVDIEDTNAVINDNSSQINFDVDNDDDSNEDGNGDPDSSNGTGFDNDLLGNNGVTSDVNGANDVYSLLGLLALTIFVGLGNNNFNMFGYRSNWCDEPIPAGDDIATLLAFYLSRMGGSVIAVIPYFMFDSSYVLPVTAIGVSAAYLGMSAVNSPNQILPLAALQGAGEGAAMTGIASTIGMNYQGEDVILRSAAMQGLLGVSSAVSGWFHDISRWIDSLSERDGWRWLFTILGGIGTVTGALTLIFMSGYAQKAIFLLEKGINYVKYRQDQHNGPCEMNKVSAFAFKSIFQDPKVYILTLSYGISRFSANCITRYTAIVSPYMLETAGRIIPAFITALVGISTVLTFFPILFALIVSIIVSKMTVRMGFLSPFLLIAIAMGIIGWGFIIYANSFLQYALGEISAPSLAESESILYAMIILVNASNLVSMSLILAWALKNCSGKLKILIVAAVVIIFDTFMTLIAKMLLSSMSSSSAGMHRITLLVLCLCILSLILVSFQAILFIRENRNREKGRRDYRYLYPYVNRTNMGDFFPSYRYTN
ncbi:hypothetical protein CANCADRAFT_57699 [Tortispora caseinolytica NRRL Y-17796]|uniref:Major facilitator superfamily (MFS) profile domain-containing protein n=1 Tax=Tortispora caseinolytica NRRL Y-17796 TaxID=767744 RepID=A0A1E4T9Z1_9ASCO|nr:hypothetical protein CANCADRAFT_57699 [Tortispora caseinolytica NRRL Y-17796]